MGKWAVEEGKIPAYTSVFDRPYSAALIVCLLLAAGPRSPAPETVRESFNVLAFLPMIRLARQVLNPSKMPLLSALGTLFALDSSRRALLPGTLLLDQGMILLEMFLGFLLMVLSPHFKDILHGNDARPHGMPARTLRVGVFGIGFIFIVGFLAGLFGYMRLARLLASGLLGGGALALVLYSYLRVVDGLMAFALRVWPLRLLRMVKHHSRLLERHLHRVFIWTGVIVWGMRSLDYVGLFQPAQSLARDLFAAKLELGTTSISAGEVISFIATLWISYLLSSFIRFILEEDVYPSMRLSSGVSFAVSSLVHYLILAVGLMLAMAALGINLDRVTVMVGAFGVGIGFGLQSVVNNFVSGLILLFERPIQVGDTIQLGELMGDVRRIGIRASTVRTREGADMVVPNAELVTQRLTNWTLGDRLRRVDLQVGVNYGASPASVIEMLVRVAGTHPKILRNPAPRGFFKDYGESSINFELRAWTDRLEDHFEIRSDLAVAVYEAVLEAGLQFPFPQREVRVLNEVGSAADLAGRYVAAATTSEPQVLAEASRGRTGSGDG